MTSQNLFEEIDRKMKDILARGPAADLEKNLRALLASAFGRLDLVTREEFDVQREVLARTRARLQELEAKLSELEKRAARWVIGDKTPALARGPAPITYHLSPITPFSSHRVVLTRASSVSSVINHSLGVCRAYAGQTPYAKPPAR